MCVVHWIIEAKVQVNLYIYKIYLVKEWKFKKQNAKPGCRGSVGWLAEGLAGVEEEEGETEKEEEEDETEEEEEREEEE